MIYGTEDVVDEYLLVEPPGLAAHTNDANVFSGASDWQPLCAIKNGFSLPTRSRKLTF